MLVAVRDISDYYSKITGCSYLKNKLSGVETARVFSGGGNVSFRCVG